MLVYLAVNGAAILALGRDQLASVPAYGARILTTSGRSGGEALMGILVIIACLSSLSGMVFTGARIYFALGLRHGWMRWLSHWDQQRGTPPRSLLAQAAIGCLLLLFAGRDSNGFDRLVILAAPCYWGFIGLACLAILVLRKRDRITPVLFAVPGYPVAPLLFAALCLIMVAASGIYVVSNLEAEVYYSIGMLALGVALSIFVGTSHYRTSHTGE